MMTARVITTLLRLRRPTHACIVVMTLAVIMLRKMSSCFAKCHHASQNVIMLRKIMNGTSLACVGGNLPPLLISIGQCDFSHGDRCIVTKHLYDVVCPYRGNQLNLIR